MATATLTEPFAGRLQIIDQQIRGLNNQKIQLLFDAIGLTTDKKTIKELLSWGLIKVTVPDRGLAISLNRHCTYVPNLTFVFDTESEPFTLQRGTKGRRIWKDRE